jgi:O-antigen/teichoic acid export membrane protein
LAFIGTGQTPPSARAAFAALLAQVKSWLADGSETSRTGRRAGTAFLIRLSGAVLAYASQILFAHWMGTFQFGIYVYVWTWVMLIGGVLDFGLCAAAQRFIPEYTQRETAGLLRGFHSGSRWLALAISSGMAILGVLAVSFAEPWLNEYEISPLYLACLSLPMLGLLNVQSGIARAHNWVPLAQLPVYVIRQLLMIVLMGAAYVMAFSTSAVTAVVISVVSLWLVALGQFLVLNRRIAATIEPGPHAYEVRNWLSISLPMAMVDGFYLLLTYSNVLLLDLFQTPQDIAVYYAADKTLALVAFVHYAVAQTTAHKFSQYHFAGNREELAASLLHAIRMTFWPSLAATILVLICGIPLLWLFGRDFVAGYPLMFILAVGLLSRSAVGPLATFLNMIGQQRACAMIFAGAFVINCALCLALIPPLGTIGAAISCAVALVVESAALFFVTKRRLGFHGLIWGAAAPAQKTA